jgi:hypothetical protein
MSSLSETGLVVEQRRIYSRRPHLVGYLECDRTHWAVPHWSGLADSLP